MDTSTIRPVTFGTETHLNGFRVQLDYTDEKFAYVYDNVVYVHVQRNGNHEVVALSRADLQTMLDLESRAGK